MQPYLPEELFAVEGGCEGDLDIQISGVCGIPKGVDCRQAVLGAEQPAAA